MISVHRNQQSKTKPWVARWRDAGHVNRSKSFRTKAEAEVFDREISSGVRQDREAQMVDVLAERASGADELRRMATLVRFMVDGRHEMADAFERRADELEAGS